MLCESGSLLFLFLLLLCLQLYYHTVKNWFCQPLFVTLCWILPVPALRCGPEQIGVPHSFLNKEVDFLSYRTFFYLCNAFLTYSCLDISLIQRIAWYGSGSRRILSCSFSRRYFSTSNWSVPTTPTIISATCLMLLENLMKAFPMNVCSTLWQTAFFMESSWMTLAKCSGANVGILILKVVFQHADRVPMERCPDRTHPDWCLRRRLCLQSPFLRHDLLRLERRIFFYSVHALLPCWLLNLPGTYSHKWDSVPVVLFIFAWIFEDKSRKSCSAEQSRSFRYFLGSGAVVIWRKCSKNGCTPKFCQQIQKYRGKFSCTFSISRGWDALSRVQFLP